MILFARIMADHKPLLSEDVANLRFSEPGTPTSTASGAVDDSRLTEEDIFMMKNLRSNRSFAPSEMAEQSVMSVADSASNFDEHVTEQDVADHEQHDGSAKNGSRDAGSLAPCSSPEPPAPSHHTDRLRQEDIIYMKGLRNVFAASERAESSVLSNADSASNFEEHVPEEDFNESEVAEQEAVSDEEDQENEDQHIVVGHFAFRRNRIENPDLPKDTVVELNYAFDPEVIPPGEDPEAYKAAFRQAKVYLVGTAHFSPESQKDVLKTIRVSQPDIVMVELCASRISILQLDEKSLLEEAQNITYEKMKQVVKQSGLIQGILHILLLTTSANITKKLGMAPGGEFRAAHQGALHIDACRLILGDRPLAVTLTRALHSLGFFQKLRLFIHILRCNSDEITQEDVENCKKKDLLEELLKEMSGEFPQLSKIFVDERDKFMANTLHTLIKQNTQAKRAVWRSMNDPTIPFQPISIVAVVGIGHMPGIMKYWDQHIDIMELMRTPPPSKTGKYIRNSFYVFGVGITAYFAIRVGSFVVRQFRR
uniref:TraB domain-containing protein n=1 Tax=Steinernema glaseri TaxID=37863 RepID=A0A1I7Z155_9BILA